MLASASVSAGNEAPSKSTPFDAKPIVLMGYAFGGEDMGGLKYDDGSNTDISAGGGFTFGAGVDLSLNQYELIKDRDLGVRLTANYHFDSATADNGEVDFDRYEFNIMPYVSINEKVNLAAGVSFHTGVEYVCKLDQIGCFEGVNINIEYAGATALVAELTYKQSEQLSFAFRATSVEYEAKTVNGVSVNGGAAQDGLLKPSGSNFGAYMVYAFNN